MVNSDVVKSEYTIADGVVTYAIGFQYMWSEDKQPQILVYAGPEANRYLEYGTDYTVSDDDLSIVLSSELAAGTKLTIMSDIPFTQTSDYTIGRIDPKQIEGDFDKAVIRDNEIRTTVEEVKQGVDSALDIIQEFADDVEEIRAGAEAGATAVQPEDLATVATTGSYNDLTDKPEMNFATAEQGAKADTAVQPNTSVEFEDVYSTFRGTLSMHRGQIQQYSASIYALEDGIVFYNYDTTHGTVRYSMGFDGDFVCLSGTAKYLGNRGYPWQKVYAQQLNNGQDIDVPNLAGALIVATPPTTDGTYILKATVSSGVVTYSWVAE